MYDQNQQKSLHQLNLQIIEKKKQLEKIINIKRNKQQYSNQIVLLLNQQLTIVKKIIQTDQQKQKIKINPEFYQVRDQKDYIGKAKLINQEKRKFRSRCWHKRCCWNKCYYCYIHWSSCWEFITEYALCSYVLKDFQYHYSKCCNNSRDCCLCSVSIITLPCSVGITVAYFPFLLCAGAISSLKTDYCQCNCFLAGCKCCECWQCCRYQISGQIYEQIQQSYSKYEKYLSK